MNNKMNGVGMTSLLVAAMREKETNRSASEGRLFTDPFAAILTGDEGRALALRAIAEVGDQPAIAVRTSYIDEKFKKALNDGATQVVMLAAGMDSRAYRLDFPRGVKLFELDQAEVLNYKREKIGPAKPMCERLEISTDLNGDWGRLLIKSGFVQKQKTLWLVEGLLMYLAEKEVISLFEKISALASSNDILVCDILGKTLLAMPHMQKQLEFLASIGAPWKFGTDEPEEFLAQFGWKATTTHPAEHSPDRWPFPAPPPHVKGVPRSFFVWAIKD